MFTREEPMPRVIPTFAATLAALCAGATWAEPARAPAAGRIESDEGRVEILGRALKAGDTIQLPEGYLRVEEDGDEEREVGSFSIVPARTPEVRVDVAAAEPEPSAGSEGTASGAAVEAPPPAPAGAPGAPSARALASCRAERSAYLAELWRLSGIEVSSPSDLLEGLEGPADGPRAGFFWFALQTDPFRPLAWSSELRARAEALSRCVRGS
jgi:hypothetical protein